MSIDPVTLALLGTIASAGSAAVGAIAAVNQANYQKAVAENNAFIAEENRKSSVFEAQVAAQDQDALASGELGALLAHQSASGLNLGAGSSLLQRNSLSALAAQDRQRTRFAGDVEAAGFEQQADAFRAEAANAARAGRFAILGGVFDVGGSLISGATSINKAKQNLLLNKNAVKK